MEAKVTAVWNDFDTRLGPRTFVRLSEIVVHAGRAPTKDVFSELGGPLPDGRYVDVKESTDFTIGARYVLFFGREACIYTPIWARLAFRLEQTTDKTIVLGPEGTPVLQFGLDGVRFGHTPLLTQISGEAPPATAFLPNLAKSNPDVKKAISSADFVLQAVQATFAAGGPLGEEFSIEPSSTERWDVSPTAP